MGGVSENCSVHFCATCRVGLIHIQVLNFYQDISLFLLVIMWDKHKNRAPIFGNGINTTIYHLRLVVWNVFYFAIYWLAYFSEGLKPPTRLYIYGDDWGTVNMALWTTHSPTFFWVGSRRASTRPMEATSGWINGIPVKQELAKWNITIFNREINELNGPFSIENLKQLDMRIKWMNTYENTTCMGMEWNEHLFSAHFQCFQSTLAAVL